MQEESSASARCINVKNEWIIWIARINAAARMNGLSYSKFMHGLKLANIDVNRKMLAELAVNDAEGFATLADLIPFTKSIKRLRLLNYSG